MKKRASLVANFELFTYTIEFVTRANNLPVEKPFNYERLITKIQELQVYFNSYFNSEIKSELTFFYLKVIERGIKNIISISEAIPGNEIICVIYLNMFISYLLFIFKESSQVTNLKYLNSNFYDNLSFLNIEEESSLLGEQKARLYEKESPAQKMLTYLENDFGDLLRYKESRRKNVFSNDRVYNTIQFKIERDNFIIVKHKYFFDFLFELQSNGKLTSLLEPLYIICGALERIENVRITIINIHKGSLIANLFLWADDVIAKEETELTLKATTDISYFMQSQKSEDDKNSKTENARIYYEMKNIYKMVEEEEITRKLIELSKTVDPYDKAIKKLQLIQNRLAIIKQVSELIAHGIIQAEEIKISISDIPFIEFKNGKFYIINGDIDRIDKIVE